MMVRRTVAGRPSALIVPVPAADSVVALHRMTHDPAATLGMPAHITVLFPFLPTRLVGPAEEAWLREALANFAAFPFRLSGIGRFRDVLYLAPAPAERFLKITDAVRERWPAYQPYEGEHPVVVPHLSVAHGSWPVGLESELARALPIETEATEVWLLTQTRSGRWSVRLEIGLRR
jgi:2'-5' RNA ligase